MNMDFEQLKQSILPAVDAELTDAEELEVVLQRVVSKFQSLFGFDESTKERLLEDLRTNYNTTASMVAVLRSQGGYEAWLEDRRSEINWNLWNRYRYYLRTVKNRPEPVIRSLDETTDKILDLLADPSRSGQPFDRRGLVMGYVQSGKTANYTALINKAFDAGFKVIIVLAGLHNNLRSQTQWRLDEEVLGFTMNRTKSQNVGVGLLKGYQTTATITPLTHFGDAGDFSARRASVAPPPPILLVVKKNKSILSNVLTYFRGKFRSAETAECDGHPVLLNLPLLMIDDEADQASINTADIYDDDDEINPEYDPSTINKLIRDIFYTFDQRAYVGYTATPFANMLIDRDSYTDKFGQDLFPRDFIIGMPRPSNYAGPAEYFNLNDDPDNQEPGLVRIVEQDKIFMPDKHKKSHYPTYLPSDLVDAIYSYLIATAIRRLRGQVTGHSSMLVHVTRFTQVQNRVWELVKEKVYAIRNEIRYGYGKSAHDVRLQELYETDFVPTSAGRKDGGDTFDWPSVRSEINKVLNKLDVRQINGESDDVLNYTEHKEGLYVLAVGGDKLSRGLTLEGLTVSYYLRPSQMYDTLMQMGRWFGYRDGYLDLCRIFTTRDLANHFFHIAMAMESLRAQLDEMAERGLTPEDYVIEISAHPDLRITSPNKMRAAVTVSESYSARCPQTVVFDNKKAFFAQNFAATERFINRIGGKQTLATGNAESQPIAVKAGHYCWTNVKSDDVLAFLREYRTSPYGTRAQANLLREYIEQRVADGELTKWTVVLINSGSESSRRIADLELRSGVLRAGERQQYSKDAETLNIRILTSGNHEFLDFTSEQWGQAEKILKQAEGKGSRRNREALKAKARALRSPDQGMLLLYPLATDSKETVAGCAREELGLTDDEIPIGIAISFPKSDKAQGHNNAVVNRSLLSER